MPVRGTRAAICKAGHDLTLPNARLPVGNQRGGGACRQCQVERQRAHRGSTKVGPPSKYRGDENARLAAAKLGLKRCPQCGEAKDPAHFNADKGSPDGLSCYCRACRAADKRRIYLANREALLLRKQFQAFGVTTDFLVTMLATQGHACAICKRECPTGRALAVDHDHVTGKVRGLLCANCNRALGLLQDDPQVVLAAAAYLTERGGPGCGSARSVDAQR